MNTKSKRVNFLLFIFGVLVFSYTAVRAYLLSITWDEAYSYIEFVRNGIFYPTRLNMMSANNHWLYSWLQIQFLKLFPVNEFTLRLPSLLSHVLFLFYSGRLVSHFKTTGLALFAFVVINVNPYLLDFFSLARGYGLSVGLMMASIYYLFEFVKQGRNKFISASLLLGALSVLANLVLLNYFLALFMLSALLILDNTFKSDKRTVFAYLVQMIIPVSVFSLLLWIVLPMGFKLREAGALFFGGSKGFWEDTVSTIINKSLYEWNYATWLTKAVKGFVLLVVLSVIVFVLVRMIKKRTDVHLQFLALLLLLIVSASAFTVIQNRLMGTLFLMDRTALFLAVMFSILFVFFINELAKQYTKLSVIMYLTGIIALIHFFIVFNFSYVLEWKSEAETKQMLSDLEKIKQIPPERFHVNLGIPMQFDPGINFYRDVNDLTWLNTVCRADEINLLNDYFYLSPEEYNKVKDSVEVIKIYPLTKSILAKSGFNFDNPEIHVNKELSFERRRDKYLKMNKNREFSRTISYRINDSIMLQDKSIVTFWANVKAPVKSLCNLSMVIIFQDGDNCYSWQRAYVKDYIKQDDVWTDVYFSCIVPETVKNGDKLKAYFWNVDGHELMIKKMGLKWMRYN